MIKKSVHNIPLKFLLPAVVVFFLIVSQLRAAEEGLDDVLGGFDAPKLTEPDNSNADDVFDGFGDQAPNIEQTKRSPALLPPWLVMSGGLSISSSYNFSHDSPIDGQTDQRGFSRLRSAVDLETDILLPKNWKGKIAVKGNYDGIYSLKGRGDYTQEVLAQYEAELELSEVYLQGEILSNLDFKIGRQIVVWGKSDNIRVTDILNPLDNREPGLVDIRDLRLPVVMTKVDYYRNSWNFSGIVLNENRFNKNPVYGNDFYMGSGPAPLEEKPSTGLDNQEYAFAANGIFSGWDMSFYGARLFDDQAHIENTAAGPRFRHSRINMLGSAVNVVYGSLLLKAEVAYLAGLEYSIDVGRQARLDALVGSEYTGISETVLSLELVDRHSLSFDDRLNSAPVYGQEDEFQYVVRMSRDYYNDTLQITALFSLFGIAGEDGAMQRFSVQYDLTDSTAMTIGTALYQDGDKASFRNIGDNDRIFGEIRYSF